MNGLRAEEAPKHFNTTCEIRCVKPYYRCDLYPHSCSANNVMYRMSRMLVEIKYLCTLTAFIEGVTGIIIDQCAKSIIYIYIYIYLYMYTFFFFLKQHLVMYKLKKTWHLIPNISLKSDRIPRKLIFKFPVALIFRCFLTFFTWPLCLTFQRLIFFLASALLLGRPEVPTDTPPSHPLVNPQLFFFFFSLPHPLNTFFSFYQS